MPLFYYTTVDAEGTEQEGSIEAFNEESAIKALQRRGLTVSSIEAEDENGGSILEMNLKFLERVSYRDLVILSRQIATMFEAQVSALRVFEMLGSETENPKLQRVLNDITDDLQAGTSISEALSKHPDVFSNFYVNVVRAGEESGQIGDVFLYLADYLDRTYEIIAKARNALIYPAFVITTFIAVMVLMLTLVIPRISDIFADTGQELPIYTKAVIGLSNFLLDYGLYLAIVLAVGAVFAWRYSQKANGRRLFDQMKLDVPYVGSLYRKLYLSRIADNLSTMLTSGIPMVRALEITSSTIDNKIYEDILEEATQEVKSGSAVSAALSGHGEIPSIMNQMMKVGEETGELGSILKTLAKFYRREVNNAVDTLVNLIEPILIVALGLGVGVLLASVLLPIYNLSSGI